MRREFGKTADTAEKLNDALRNVPMGLKLAFRRFQATTGYVPGGATGGGGAGGGRGGGGGGTGGGPEAFTPAGVASVTFSGNTFILPGVRNGREFLDSIKLELRRDAARGGFGFSPA
jgi:hypothetical protein